MTSYYKLHPEYQERKKELQRLWHKNHRHPCPKCGELCSYKAKHCRNCSDKRRNYKGGRSVEKDGYVLIRKPDHPRAKKTGYVREHILIWEQVNNKPLPKGWIVHHLNGIKTDNSPRNLVGLPNRKHMLVLQAKAKRIQELEALLNGQSQLI